MPLEDRAQCDQERLEQYSMGRLAARETAELEEHLLICPQCRDDLERHDRYVRAMRTVTARLLAEETPRWWRLPGWITRAPRAWALTAALCAAAGLALYRQRVPGLPGEPVAVTLLSLRGAASAEAPAGRPFRASLDIRGLAPQSSWDSEIVDAGGRRVWRGALTGRGDRAEGLVRSGLSPGSYYVRLRSPSGELLREFTLAAR